VLAADLNLLAARTACDNVRRNHLDQRILVVQGRAEELVGKPAELVVANIHYAVMGRLIDSGSFADKKRFILSGLLRSEARAIRAALDRPPYRVFRVWDHENTWYTFYGQTES
jgi:ribosomal protein L11 methyltransferase